MQQNTYTIKLTQFEGPFDLLLFFIERDELNIYDIPISTITEDFLNYIREMEALNIDLASEFILVAATLMRIKAKMLIPRKEVDEEGNEVDPRDELVARLLEYKRYKGILEEMRGYEENRAKQFERGNISSEMKKLAERALIDAELESLTLFKLLKAFGNVLERVEDRKKKSVHKVYAYNYTIPNQQIYIFTKIREGAKTNFKEIFGSCENRMHAIITFLALLELLNMQRLKVTGGGNGEGVNVMILEQPSHEDDVMGSGEGEDFDGEEGEEGEQRDNEYEEENAEENINNEAADNDIENDINNIENNLNENLANQVPSADSADDHIAAQAISNNTNPNIGIPEDTFDDDEDYSPNADTDVDAELNEIKSLVETKEAEGEIEALEDSIAGDLEAVINSAVEVGTAGMITNNNPVTNFSKEEE